MNIRGEKCMLSIQFHYSDDRLEVLEQVIRIFEKSPEFNSCEKIILHNGECRFNKFTKIKLEYPFNRMEFWKKGQEVASYNKILYLDSDRLFPFELFDRFVKLLDDNDFVYPAQHYLCKYSLTDKLIIKILTDSNFRHYMKSAFDLEEDRTSDIKEAIGRRNPMSGCLAYHKNTSIPDQGFIGWGFSDMLWFRHSIGKKFCPIQSFDIHLHHSYDKTRYYQLANSLLNGMKFGVVDTRLIGLAKRVGIYKTEGVGQWKL